MQVVKNIDTVTITISKAEIDLFKVVSSYLESTEQTSTIFKELPMESVTSIAKVEPTVIAYEEIPTSAPAPAPIEAIIGKKEHELDKYARIRFESLKTSAKYNYKRVGICIINSISEIPVLEKGDKGIKDEQKIDIKCAIAKVLGYYVKNNKVYSKHHKELWDKITYKFKKNEPNAGSQLQLKASDFKEYLVKLEYRNEFQAELDANNGEYKKVVYDDEDEALNIPKIASTETPKPHFTAKEVVQHLESQKPTITYPYQIDSKGKKIKSELGFYPACVGYDDLTFEDKGVYGKWWFEVGQKLLTTQIAEITI